MYLLKLGIDLLGGGITGYITNKYAIKMLFKKYGPFGGVIIDTREDFARNISQLVENKIINNRTIQEELEGEAFREAFQQLVDDFLQVSLYEHTGPRLLGEVPGWEDFSGRLARLAREQALPFTRRFLDTLPGQVPAEKLVGPAQREHLAFLLWEIFREVWEEDRLLGSFFQDLVQELQEVQLFRLVHPGLIQALAGNLGGLAAELPSRLQGEFDQRLQGDLRELYRLLQVKGLFQDLEGSLGQQSLEEFLGKERAARLRESLIAGATRFIDSPGGLEVMEQLAGLLLEVIKGLQLSLLDVLPEDLQGNLENFLEKELPGIIAGVIYWIRSQKEELEEQVDQAVEEALQQEGGLRGRVKEMLKEMFLPSVAHRYQVVARLTGLIQEDSDPLVLGRSLTRSLLGYLRERSLGEMARELEERGFLDAKVLARFLQRQSLALLGSPLLAVQLDRLFCVPLGELFGKGYAGQVDDYARQSLPRWLKEEILYSSSFAGYLQGLLAASSQGWGAKTLGGLWAWREGAAGYLEGWFLGEARRRGPAVAAAVASYTGRYLEGKTLEEAARPWLTSLRRENLAVIISESLVSWGEGLGGRLGKVPLEQVYERLNRVDGVKEGITRGALGLVDQNLDRVLEGKIQATVEKSLSVLPDRELRDMVEGFMGQELKPITGLGALLGTISGGGLFLAQEFFLPRGMPIQLGMPFVVYGLVGYFTNVIALKMIFRPHGEKRILGVRVPLTPGVIARQKPRFASSLGTFIDRRLLEREAVGKLFARQKPVLEGKILEELGGEGYRLTLDLLEHNRGALGEKITQLSLEKAGREKEKIAFSLAGRLEGLYLRDVVPGGLEKALPAGAEKVLPLLVPRLADKLGDTLGKEEPLGDIIPPYARGALRDGVEKFISGQVRLLEQWLGEDKGEELTAYLAPHYRRLSSREIRELPWLPPGETLQAHLGQVVGQQVQSPGFREGLGSLLGEKLRGEFSPEREINQLFGGEFLGFIQEKAGQLVDGLIRSAGSYLIGEKGKIKKIVKDDIREEGGWTYRLGNWALDIDGTIDRVVDDLVDRRFPRLLAQKEYQLKILLDNYIRYNLAEKRVGELGLSLDFQGLAGAVDRLMEDPGFSRGPAILSSSLVDRLYRLKVGELLGAVGIQGPRDLYSLFSPLINQCREGLAENLEKNEGEIQSLLSGLGRDLMERTLFNCPLERLARGVTREQLSWTVNRTGGVVLGSGAFRDLAVGSGRGALGRLEGCQVAHILDPAWLRRDLGQVLEGLLAGDSFREECQSLVGRGLEVLQAELFRLLPQETLDFAAQVGVKSFLDSLDKYLLDLINALNLKEVAEREVNHMDSRQLEELFHSFAAPYFRKLESYGFLGSFVGVFNILPRLIP